MFVNRQKGVSVPESPVMVIALEGWIDAGYAAATATGLLMEQIPSDLLYSFDADALIDHRARRPHMVISNGVISKLTWPQPTIRVGRDRNGKGVVFLVGPEPDLLWHAFSDEVVRIARELDVSLVVSLGGFPFAWPHTRPVRLAATASSQELAEKVGFLRGTIEAPAGLADVIASHCGVAGIDSVGLWARVPHYVASMPFPAAALALIEGLTLLTGIDVDVTDLDHSAAEARDTINDLIVASAEHVEMVRNLEEQASLVGPDDDTGAVVANLPSGDEIAAELERYLRGEVQ